MWKGLLIAVLPAASLYAILAAESPGLRNMQSKVRYAANVPCFSEQLSCKPGRCGYEIRNSWRGEVKIGSITLKGASDLAVKKAVLGFIRQLDKMVPVIPETRAELVRVRYGYEVRCSSKGMSTEVKVTGLCAGSRHVASAFGHALCHAICEFLFRDGSPSFRSTAAHYMNACLSYEYYIDMQKQSGYDENWYRALETLAREGIEIFKLSPQQIRERAVELGAIAENLK